MTRTFWGIFLALLVLAVLAWWVLGQSQRQPDRSWFGAGDAVGAGVHA